MSACPNCNAIAEMEAGRHPFAIARLSAGYVWLNDCRFYEGAAFYVAKSCVAELYELDAQERSVHLMEMAAVAAAVSEAFGARKMNYEALGNLVPHLHWWLTPRPPDDPRPHAPIWENLDFLRLLWTGRAGPEPARAAESRRRILDHLRRQDVGLEATYV